MVIQGSGDVPYPGRITDDIALDYVFVLELLEQADLANGGTRNTFVFCFQPNLLEGDDLVGGDIPGLVHDTVSSWENGVDH